MIEKIKNDLLWLAFTNHCPYCGSLLGKDEKLCKNCLENLPVIKGERCTFCGAGKDRCSCKKHRLKYDGVIAPFYYEDGVCECIRRLKFRGKDFAAYTLAKDMAECVEKEYGGIGFDFITFVPFSLRQKAQRPYNQSELLAQELSSFTKIPLKNCLVKLYDSSTQHETEKNRRRGNVFGIYDVKNGADVRNKTVLLVDDIKTTGATLSECAVILKIRGAKAVYCVTAAVSAKKKKNST